MSLAIVLLSWIAASILVSPLIGRFLSAQDESQGRSEPRLTQSQFVSVGRQRQRVNTAMRRNAAIQLSRREAGWPRAG